MSFPILTDTFLKCGIIVYMAYKKTVCVEEKNIYDIRSTHNKLFKILRIMTVPFFINWAPSGNTPYKVFEKEWI